MSRIQAILFNKYTYTINEAENFIKKYNLKPIKRVHETKKFYRYRLIKPDGKIYNYRLKKINDDISFIFQYKKK